MQVPTKKIKFWLKMKEQGDLKRLMEFADVKHYSTLKRAFEGNTSAELMNKIDQFFEKKQTSISK